jgi:hypothetical protein
MGTLVTLFFGFSSAMGVCHLRLPQQFTLAEGDEPPDIPRLVSLPGGAFGAKGRGIDKR